MALCGHEEDLALEDGAALGEALSQLGATKEALRWVR